MYWTPDDFVYPPTKAVRASVSVQAVVFKRVSDRMTRIECLTNVCADAKLMPKSFVDLAKKEIGHMVRHFVKQVDKAESERIVVPAKK